MDPLKEGASSFACRVCESKDLLMNIFVNASHQIAEKLCYCASIQMSENDGLPQHICTKCFTDLQISYNFRKRCEETDAKLRSSLNAPVKVEILECMVPSATVADVDAMKAFDYTNDGESRMIIKVEPVLDTSEEDTETDSNIHSTDTESDAEISHDKNVQSGKAKKPIKYTCPTCLANFTIRTEYSEHVKTHGAKRFQCRTCLKWFSRKAVWEKHESVHAGTNKRHPCDQCSKDFSSTAALARHIADIHEKRLNFACDICFKKFPQKSHLKAHESVHTGGTYKCTKCEAVLKSRQGWMRHEQLHLPPEERDPKFLVKPNPNKTYRKPLKTYICSFCGKVFNNQTTYVLHERSHTGEKPFPCEICGKAFISNKHLRRHYRVHTGERPYECETCGKCFQEKAHRKTHYLTHTQERNFVCPICSKAFALKATLKSHMKCHSVCEEGEQQ